jgi:hypothetical protein
MTLPITNEPTHIEVDQDGNEIVRPGAVNLRADVTVEKVAESDAVNAEFYSDAQQRNRASSMNPQVAEPYTPLQNLSYDALREYGEMNPSTIDGDTNLLFLRLANKIVEDVRMHPLYPMPDLDYYVALTDTRPIPDIIMIAGLQYYYAMQQASEKVRLKEPEYYRRLNSTMYNRLYGNGKIEIKPRE